MVATETLDEFRNSLRRFVEFYGDMPVDQISRSVVQDYRSKLAGFPVKKVGASKLRALNWWSWRRKMGCPRCPL